MEWGAKIMAFELDKKIRDAICSSFYLDNPTPPVIAWLGKESFEMSGVHHVPFSQRKYGTTVGIYTRDRQRFLNQLDGWKRHLFHNWGKRDYDMYSAFYVPASWFDSFEIVTE